MGNCTDVIKAAHAGSNLLTACLQSEATRHAAAITAHATVEAGYLGLAAGALAILGAVGVLLDGRYHRAESRRRAEQDHRRAVVQMASVYIAELQSLWKFLGDNLIIDGLRSSAAAGQHFDFTPGESWLLTYIKDPATIGLFDAEIATMVASCYSRSINELGRLRWLHKWKPREDKWRADQQVKSADTLADLKQQSTCIISALAGLINKKTASGASKHR